MRMRNKLLTILMISVATVMFWTAMIGREADAATTPVISVSPFANSGAIGTIFSINITLAQATKIPNYQFWLYYNETILTATSFDSFAPFNTAYPSFINDTGGYVEMAYITYLGDKEGLTTTDPVPIATIQFTVEANGTTTLDLQKSKMTNVLGNVIDPIPADGMFSNVAEIKKHDIAITAFTISSTSVSSGGSVSIDVTVKNNGDFNETFSVSADYNGTLIQNQTNISLEPGDSKSLSYTWNTANTASGNWLVTAKVRVARDDLPGDNAQSGLVTITGGGGGLSFNTYLIAGAVIVIVAVVVAIYALRARKPK